MEMKLGTHAYYIISMTTTDYNKFLQGLASFHRYIIRRQNPAKEAYRDGKGDKMGMGWFNEQILAR